MTTLPRGCSPVHSPETNDCQPQTLPTHDTPRLTRRGQRSLSPAGVISSPASQRGCSGTRPGAGPAGTLCLPVFRLRPTGSFRTRASERRVSRQLPRTSHMSFAGRLTALRPEEAARPRQTFRTNQKCRFCTSQGCLTRLCTVASSQTPSGDCPGQRGRVATVLPGPLPSVLAPVPAVPTHCSGTRFRAPQRTAPFLR